LAEPDAIDEALRRSESTLRTPRMRDAAEPTRSPARCAGARENPCFLAALAASGDHREPLAASWWFYMAPSRALMHFGRLHSLILPAVARARNPATTEQPSIDRG
jgi:hypothetical protein